MENFKRLGLLWDNTRNIGRIPRRPIETRCYLENFLISDHQCPSLSNFRVPLFDISNKNPTSNMQHAYIPHFDRIPESLKETDYL